MKIKFVLIFCLISYVGFAQSQLESSILKGLEYFYNFQFDKAEQKFNDIIKKYPEKPQGYHYLAQMYLWKYIGCKDEDEFSNFTKYSDLALQKAEEIIEKDGNNYDVKYILASTHLLRVLASAQKEPNFDAIGDTKIAINYFEEIIEDKPKFYDAYLGLGILDYALSYVPGLFKWGLAMIGLSADKDRGLNYINKTYTKGKYSKTEAGLHLSNIYSDYLANYKGAIKILKSLTSKYPNNSVFNYQLGSIYIKAKKLNDAEKSLNKVIQLNNKSFIQTNAYAYFLKGQIAFMKNDFEKAIPHYETFLEMTLEPNYSGIANYRLAICNYISGDKIKYLKHLKLASSGNLDISDDYYANVKSGYLLENEIKDEDILLIKAQNLFESGKYKDAFNILNEKSDSLSNIENRGLAFYIVGESSYQLKKYNDAIEFCSEISSIDVKIENWIIPSGAFTIAKAYYEKKEYEKSEDWLSLSERNNTYTYKEKLEPYILSLKQKLEGKNK
ncbi:MAG: DUF3808 domain-containing protein [Ignavibacteriales bacterium]|nr:DUF3808 domain-containing protein [Ignavibacteriales bacterium]